MKGDLEKASKRYALRIVKMCQFLQDERHEHILSKQVLRSGTSIGANIAEAQYAQSRDDFISKLKIALKEASETCYWVELLRDAEYVPLTSTESMLADCGELMAMLTASLNTLGGNSGNGN